ncbi:MAG: UPF0149 family protein [Candidatus Binataceae bacterium]|jgi:uncharacterized protein
MAAVSRLHWRASFYNSNGKPDFRVCEVRKNPPKTGSSAAENRISGTSRPELFRMQRQGRLSYHTFGFAQMGHPSKKCRLAGRQMKGSALLAYPLTETEIAQLDDFLISDSVPEEAMDLSMMDGFITALASGPNLMMPSSMLRWIWDSEHGKDVPTFANAAEAASITTLIMRHWNDINETLNRAPAEYEPLLLERKADGRTIQIINSWCSGYYKGIAVDRDTWNPLLARQPEWFTAIMLYGTKGGWDELERRQDIIEQHQAFADSLASSVRNIHRYWLEQRRLQIARGEIPTVIGQSEPIRRAPKVGRNVSCPCGSGKKYKRCHGAAEDAVAEDNRYPVHSPLSQRLSRDGTTVDIQIYDDGKNGWLLEVVDEFGNSTVWNESFPTDNIALAEALNTIDTEGIASVIGSVPTTTIRH